MGQPHQARAGRRADGDGRRVRPASELPPEVVAELRSTARPAKRDVIVDVFGRAAAAFAEGDDREAARLAEQCKHMAPRSASVRELLGLALYRLGRFREAARELTTFRRLSGSVEQNPVIADCYRAEGRTERALEVVEEMGADVPEPVYYEGQIVAAGALADARRYDEAIARLQRLDLDPEVAGEHHLRAWYKLADVLERRGRFTQAREFFEAVAAVDPDYTDAPERLRRLGRD